MSLAPAALSKARTGLVPVDHYESDHETGEEHDAQEDCKQDQGHEQLECCGRDEHNVHVEDRRGRFCLYVCLDCLIVLRLSKVS